MNTAIGQNSYPVKIESRADFVAFTRHHPKAHRLLKVVLFHWRRASVYHDADPDPWAVKKLEEWARLCDASERTVKRLFGVLLALDLVDKRRGRFSGSGVFVHVRPSLLALELMGKQGDFNRRTFAPDKLNKLQQKWRSDGLIDHTYPQKVSDTPYPPLSEYKIQKDACASEGHPKKTTTPQSPPPGDDLLSKVRAARKIKDKEARRKALLEILPRVNGTKKVAHPADMKRKVPWHTWSPALLVTSYGRYLTYSRNEIAAKAKRTAKRTKPDLYAPLVFALSRPVVDLAKAEYRVEQTGEAVTVAADQLEVGAMLGFAGDHPAMVTRRKELSLAQLRLAWAIGSRGFKKALAA